MNIMGIIAAKMILNITEVLGEKVFTYMERNMLPMRVGKLQIFC
jgi:hypothetical protein